MLQDSLSRDAADPLGRLPPSARPNAMALKEGLRNRRGNAFGGQDSVDADDEDDDDQKPKTTRDRLNAFLETKFCQAFMAMVTIFALYGDDIRVYRFFKAQDTGFFCSYIVCLVLFSLELTLQAMVVEGYKYSFFFILDVVATCSLIVDIPWFVQPLSNVLGLSDDEQSGGQSSQAGKASRGGARAGRIVRLVRLVRPIRVVDLTKYLSKERKSDLDAEEVKRKKHGEKRVQASRLGKILSESTTRRVVVGVLTMMILWPLLENTKLNYAIEFGLEQLFYFGRSPCLPVKDFLRAGNEKTPMQCDQEKAHQHPWMTEQGWNFLVYQLSAQSRAAASVGYLPSPMLALRVPDFTRGGELREIDFVKTIRCVPTTREPAYLLPDGAEDTPFDDCPDRYCCWKPHITCGHFREDDENCPWRKDEIKEVSYTPAICIEPTSPCSGLRLRAKFLDREYKEMEAYLSLIQTTFIIFLLSFGSISFSQDTQKLVIAPIEKMVNIVKQLADDPLKKPEVSEEEENDYVEVKNSSGQLETGMLETTILKIGSLLQVGFGEAGAQIIGMNMSSRDGELNIMTAGRKVVAIYGFCNICDFMDTTQCLLEEVMVFVNKIAHIVHTCVHEWRGAANKNMGDSFLLTWMVQDAEDQRRMLRDGIEVSDKMQELTDRSLVAFIKVVSEIRRAADLAAYAKHPKIIPKFGMSYKVRMTFSLHAGWGIEGAIGSKHKIDASYLSPSVNMAARVQEITSVYGVELLFTDAIYACLSSRARERTRKIDCILVKGADEPIGIHTFDFNNTVIQVPETSVSELANKTVDFMFIMDHDIVGLQEGISIEFIASWRNAYHLYNAGSWEHALTMFHRCTNLLPDGDGPSEALIQFITEHTCNPPPDWAGYRRLLFK